VFNHDNGLEAPSHDHAGNANLGGELESLTKEEVQMLRKLLLGHRSDWERLLAAPEVNYAKICLGREVDKNTQTD
jgi:hypothetical protein